MHDKEGKQSFLHGPSVVLVVAVLFFAVFAAAFVVTKESNLKAMAAANDAKLGIRNFLAGSGEKTVSIINSWWWALAIGLSVLGFVASLIGKAAVALANKKLANGVGLVLGFGVLLALALNIVFVEGRNTAIFNAIIFLIGYPLLYASVVAVIASVGVAVMAWRQP